MIGVKCTMKFEQSQFANAGWSELHFLSGAASSDLDAELTKAVALAHKRADCLGSQGRIQEVQVTDLARTRHHRGNTFSGNGLKSTVFTGLGSDFSDTALQVILRDLTRQNTGRIFLRGLPDDEVEDGGQYVPGPVFTGTFQAFAAQLKTDGWGFLGNQFQASTRSSDVVNVVQNADGRPTIEITGMNKDIPPVALAWTVGKKYKVNVSGIVGSAAVNGQLIGTVIDATHFKINRRTPIFPYVTGGKLTFFDQIIVGIDLATDDRIVNRKAGKPFFQQRGRSKARKLA